MAISLGDIERLRQVFTGAQERVKAAYRSALDQVGRKIESEAKKRAPYKTGILRSSIAYEVTDPAVLSVGILTAPEGHTLRYARIQDIGGVVTAKSGSHLAIPIEYPGNPVLTKSGVAGILARDVRDNPGAFGLRGTFAAKGVIFGVPQNFSGKRFGGLGGSKGWNILPLFVLKSQVRIKGNRYLTGAVEDTLPVAADFIVKRALQALSGAA